MLGGIAKFVALVYIFNVLLYCHYLALICSDSFIDGLLIG